MMHFASFSDFFAMGGYGFYVWSAFSLTFIAMGWIVIDCMRTKRKIFTELKKKMAREERVEKAKNMENTL